MDVFTQAQCTLYTLCICNVLTKCICNFKLPMQPMTMEYTSALHECQGHLTVYCSFTKECKELFAMFVNNSVINVKKCKEILHVKITYAFQLYLLSLSITMLFLLAYQSILTPTIKQCIPK